MILNLLNTFERNYKIITQRIDDHLEKKSKKLYDFSDEVSQISSNNFETDSNVSAFAPITESMSSSSHSFSEMGDLKSDLDEIDDNEDPEIIDENDADSRQRINSSKVEETKSQHFNYISPDHSKSPTKNSNSKQNQNSGVPVGLIKKDTTEIDDTIEVRLNGDWQIDEGFYDSDNYETKDTSRSLKVADELLIPLNRQPSLDPSVPKSDPEELEIIDFKKYEEDYRKSIESLLKKEASNPAKADEIIENLISTALSENEMIHEKLAGFKEEIEKSKQDLNKDLIKTILVSSLIGLSLEDGIKSHLINSTTQGLDKILKIRMEQAKKDIEIKVLTEIQDQINSLKSQS